MATPDRIVLSATPVRSVTAPGIYGYMQILCDHAPSVMLVCAGVIEIDSGNEPSRYKTEKGGYLQLQENNNIFLLLKDISAPGDKDIKQFEELLTQVQEEWKGFAQHQSPITNLTLHERRNLV